MLSSEKKKYLFEEMPVIRSVLRCAFPSVLSQLILVIYNLADTFFIALAAGNPFYVNQGLSNALISGVSICMPIFMLISAIANLFGVGAASVIARSLGKDKAERARNASRFAFYAALISFVVYSLLIFVCAKPLNDFLSGGDSAISQYSQTYIMVTVVMFGLPTGLATLFSHLFRAEGLTIQASIGITLGGVLNVALDPLFMFVFFDIKDAAFAAALATGISNVIGLLFFIIYRIYYKKSLLSFKFKKDMFKNNLPREITIVGMPACLMTLFENVSYMILDALIATVSSDVIVNQAALAGIGAAKKINMFAHSIARGMTQGVLPLIGYNKSSGRRIRMKKIIYSSILITLSLSLICLIINTSLASQLSGIFLYDSLAVSYSRNYLIVLSIGVPFSAIAYSIISFFQAVGKGWRSLILALLRKGVLDIPLMFVLIKPMSYVVGIGAVWATPIADIVCCIVSLIIFFVYLKKSSTKDLIK